MGQTKTGADRQAKTAPTRGDSGVQVLARAGDILRLLKVAPEGIAQAEMAARLGLARSTLHRILTALIVEGLVEQIGGSTRYRLGAEIMNMAEAVRTGLVSEIRPQLQALSRAVDETVDLSLFERGQVIFVDQVVAPHRLRAVSTSGAAIPLHCTANGKAILSTFSPAELDRLLPPRLEAFTEHTITDPSALKENLRQAHAVGVAMDLEEYGLGVCAIGAPVRGTRLGLAALSIPMPTQRFQEKQSVVADALRHTAQQLEKLLGSW